MKGWTHGHKNGTSILIWHRERKEKIMIPRAGKVRTDQLLWRKCYKKKHHITKVKKHTAGKEMRGRFCSITKPSFAPSTHFSELHHLSLSINGDSPCYIESEVSSNEIFKHLKSLKTNLLNVLPFQIKSSVCNYIRPLITKFHDLLCSESVRLFVFMCIYYGPFHASYALKGKSACVRVWEGFSGKK